MESMVVYKYLARYDKFRLRVFRAVLQAVHDLTNMGQEAFASLGSVSDGS